MQAAGGVDVEIVDGAGLGGGDGVVEDGRRVAALPGLDHLDAGARGPDFKLLDGGGAKCVGGAEEHGAALRAGPCGELAAGSGFAGAVDADEESDFGRRLRCGSRPLRGTEDGDQLFFQKIAELGAAFDGLMAGAVAERVEDGGGGGHAEIAREQSGFELVESGFVDGAGEGGEVGDFGGEGLAGARDGLAHAIEESFLGFGVDFSGSALPKSVVIIFLSLIGAVELAASVESAELTRVSESVLAGQQVRAAA